MEALVGKCIDGFSEEPGHEHRHPVARNLNSRSDSRADHVQEYRAILPIGTFLF